MKIVFQGCGTSLFPSFSILVEVWYNKFIYAPTISPPLLLLPVCSMNNIRVWHYLRGKIILLWCRDDLVVSHVVLFLAVLTRFR